MKISKEIKEYIDSAIRECLKALFPSPSSWPKGDLEKEIDKWLNSYSQKLTPKKQKIDLLRLIESGLDCEFSDSWKETEPAISKLKKIKIEREPYNTSRSYVFIPSAEYQDGFPFCRPRMNHIHACPDGFEECPLPKGFRISVQFKDDSICNLNTSDSRPAYSIGIAWKCVRYIEILGVSDGWEL